MGAQEFKGKVVIPSLRQGGGADLKYADIVISNAELKAIRAKPKTGARARSGQGAGVSFGSRGLAAGTNVLTEATANLAVKYQSGAGVQVSQSRDDGLHRSGRASGDVRDSETRSHHGASRFRKLSSSRAILLTLSHDHHSSSVQSS